MTFEKEVLYGSLIQYDFHSYANGCGVCVKVPLSLPEPFLLWPVSARPKDFHQVMLLSPLIKFHNLRMQLKLQQ